MKTKSKRPPVCRTAVHLAAVSELPRWTRDNGGDPPDFRCPDCGEIVAATDK